MAVPLTRHQKLGLMQLYYDIEEELQVINDAIDDINAKRRGPQRVEAQNIPKRKERAKRSCTARPWLSLKEARGQYRLLMNELKNDDPKSFLNYTRMTPEMFFYLLRRLETRISKQRTQFKKPISAGERLALTLRYYAGGDMYMSMHYGWYIAANTIGMIVRQVSQAIVEEFAEEELTPPQDPEGWKKVSDLFQRRWNFPHCIGALDGKHIAITAPQKSGSSYYNYKKFFSIMLLALVDADYKFLWVEAGCNGACSDAQIWNDCDLQDAIQMGVAGLPEAEPLEDETYDLPYFIIGDDAFALRTYMMKPYGHRSLTRPERMFNYRLSRARRIVENAFGILSNRFQCFHSNMRQPPETVTTIVLACCCLHNILRKRDNILGTLADREDEEHNLIPGRWRNQQLVDPLLDPDLNRSTKKAKEQREYLKNYINSPKGAVSWQDRMIY